MNRRRHVAVVAGGATLLATTPLTVVFRYYGWFILSAVVITLIVGTGIAARAARAPVWAQAIAMVTALTLFLSSRFRSGHELLGFIPTGQTLRHFSDLLTAAGRDMRELAIPVADREELLFLTVLGIGAVAILVDVLAVGLRHPALAGLPMLAIYSVPVAVVSGSVPALPFVAGAAGYMWLLVTDNVDRVRRWGRRFTGSGEDVDTFEPSPLAAGGRRLGFAGLVLAVLLPLSIPGLTSGWLDRFGVDGNGVGSGGSGGGGGGGNSTNVNPVTLLHGNLTRDKPIEMVRLTTTDPSPFYLRLAVADTVIPQADRQGFRNGPPHTPQPLGAGLPNPESDVSSDVARQTYTANIQVLNLDTRFLPLYAEPATIDTRKLKGYWLYDTGSDVAYSNRTNARQQKYSISFVHFAFTADELRQARPVDPDTVIGQLYSKVPANAYIQQQVAATIANKTTPYDKVRALLDYFSEADGFRYSLSTAPGTTVEAFLRNKKGYCEQYASALAWMVRAAGIPARVAVGFTRGAQDQKNQSQYTMTNFNLHAWTEVYFDGFGWVPFDPTPSANIPGSANLAWAPDPSHPVTSAGAGGADTPQNTNPNAEPTPNKGAGDNTTGGTASHRAAPAPTRYWPWVLLGVLLILVALALPAIVRTVRRRRRLSRRNRGPRPPDDTPPGPGGVGVTDAPPGSDMHVEPDRELVATAGRAEAHAAWAELTDLLIDYRIPVEESDTPRTVADRLTGRRPYAGLIGPLLVGPAADGVDLIARAEERARYARNPLRARGFADAAGAIRVGLGAGAGWRTRLMATLLPPSVMLRWRRATAAAVFTGVDRLSRARGRLAYVTAPRRLLAGRRG